MACQSIVALPKACGSTAKVAGIEKVWMISYSDVAQISGTISEIYTLSNSGVVNALGVTAGSSDKFVEIGINRSSVGLDEKLTKNIELGNSFFTQTFKLTLTDLTTANRQFVESVLNQPVVVLVKSRTRNYFIAGLNGQLELTDLEGGTGTKEEDLIGYNLTFTGIESMLVPLVDSTLIPNIIA